MTADRDEVSMEIADNGIGMDQDQKANLFNLFYSSKGQRGTGLGLFITKKVVEKHGGTIACESSPGSGARFYLVMPRRVTGIRR